MKIAKILIWIGVIGLSLVILLLCLSIRFFYTQKEISQFEEDAIKNTRMALAEAYNNHDWEKVVGYGMALEEHGDTLGDLTIAYAEGLCDYGEYGKARKLLLDRIKEHPEDHLDYLYNTMGNLCYLEGKMDDALTYYKKATEVNPHYARPFVYMAGIYSELQDVKQAISNYLKAIHLFYDHQFYEETEQFSKQVLELDKSNIEAIIYLAATYYEKGENARYEQYFYLAKTLGGIFATDRIHELIN